MFYVIFLFKLEEKRLIRRFLLAGLRFCGNLDFKICVFEFLTLRKNSVLRGAKLDDTYPPTPKS